MDRNQITGIVLIAAIFIVYFTWFAPDTEQLKNETKTEQKTTDSVNDTTKVVKTEEQEVVEDTIGSAPLNDSLVNVELQSKYGIFANAINDEEGESTNVKTKNLSVNFSSKGGNINSVELLNYQSYDSLPLILVDESNYSNEIKFTTQDGKNVSLNELSFTKTQNNSEIEFEANLGGGKKIVRSYVINDTNYTIAHKRKFVGVSGKINGNTLTQSISQDLKHLEKSMTESRRKSLLNYYADEEYDYIRGASSELEKEKIENPNWIAFKQSFFTTAIIAQENTTFKYAEIRGKTEEDSEIVKHLETTIPLPINLLSSPEGYTTTYFFGPNQEDILLSVSENLEFDENIDFGWPVLREVNKYAIYPIFKFLEKFIPSYGIVILLLVLVIKSILLPLTYSSQMGMAKMKVLKPEIDALNKKYENDKQKAQVETMNMYRQFGVNPMAGCIPMLLQMPILFAMFRLFPNLIELRQKPFLWAEDLSSYDTLIYFGDFSLPIIGNFDHISVFTLLMTVSTVIYTHFNNQITTQTQPGMKTMSYMMPIIFFFVLNNYAAGLTYYYFLSNLYTIAQTIIIRKMVDDDKIRQKLEANKVKNANKGKSSFQNTLSEALKKQQEKKRNK